jgi:predicted ATPase
VGGERHRSATEAVCAHLRSATALVVLDNCEHLVEGVVDLVEPLLSSCPGVTVLATSRTRLMVPYERVFAVPGLSATPTGDATALFLDRAAMTGWSPSSPDDERRIDAICAHLDGSALAIELAAARVATMGLAGVEAGLTDPLRLLTGGPRRATSGTVPCGPRSTGATGCSTRPARWCCAGSRCSTGRSPRRRPKRSPPTRR